MAGRFLLGIVIVLSSLLSGLWGKNLELTILHTNDVHSRFSQTNTHSGACTLEEEQAKQCFGGFARLFNKVEEIRSTNENVLYLSAGDYYQGTVWYTIHKWRIVSELVNKLNHTAMALGNHEFDDKIDGLLPFIDSVSFPIVNSNIDATEEPDFLARQRNGVVAKSLIVTTKSGQKIGIIGFTTEETPTISYPGKLRFLNVVESVHAEANRLNAEGVQILIALGHGGFDIEQEIARRVPLIDVVVGGHTNTFLYSGAPPSTEKPLGPYPFIVEQPSGRKVPCVQAYAFGKYLGLLNMTFDADGEVINAVGNPILLDASIPEDEEMLDIVRELGKNVTELTKQEVGRTEVFLNGKTEVCRMQECNLGNFVADAMVYVNLKYPEDKEWTDINMAIMNSGGIRGSIDNKAKNGSVSMEDVLQVLPFQNTVDLIEIEGAYILEAFEFSVDGYDPNGYHPSGKFLQVSGIKVVFDITKPNGSRVKSIEVLCKECAIPSYKAINLTQVYKVVIPTFIATGGDGYTMLRDKASAYYLSGTLDSDMLVEYLKEKSPVRQEVEGRINFIRGNSSTEVENGGATNNLFIPILSLIVLSILNFF